jgi:hypothetical protein
LWCVVNDALAYVRDVSGGGREVLVVVEDD